MCRVYKPRSKLISFSGGHQECLRWSVFRIRLQMFSKRIRHYIKKFCVVHFKTHCLSLGNFLQTFYFPNNFCVYFNKTMQCSQLLKLPK